MPLQQLQLKQEELEKSINDLYKHLGTERNRQRVTCETVDHVSIVGGIVDEAKKYNADIIIMGSKGVSGLQRLFVGSVAASVLDLVQCAVLVVPKGFGNREIKKIGMPTDVVHVESEILDTVAFAQLFDAEVDLFHVSARQPDGEKLEDKLQFMTGYPSITYTEILPEYEGDVVGGLNNYIENKKPDLLVMHHKNRNWFDKLISGSRTKEMIFQAQTAVLTFKKEE